MTAPTPRRRRARPALSQPPPAPLEPAGGHRAPIGPDALRAGRDAHQGHEHAGQIGRDCPTCARYLAAIPRATAAERERVLDTAVHALATGAAGLLTAGQPPQPPTGTTP